MRKSKGIPATSMAGFGAPHGLRGRCGEPERHLQDCEKCRNIYETLIAAVGTAAQDAENEPPVDALRAVKRRSLCDANSRCSSVLR